MKKILSSLLAFAMMLAVFSGMVIFTASAEEVEMHIPFINQYTLAQAQKMGTKNTWVGSGDNSSNASNYSISKDDEGRTVISFTTPAELSAQWKVCTGYLSTGTSATPFVKDGLIDGINIFGDAELSNKTKLALKLDGDANFKSAFSNINLMLNSGTERVCLSLQGPTKSNGYLIYDFSKITRNNYDESAIALPSAAGNLHDAFDGRISTLNMAIIFNKTNLPVTFWFEDVYLIGAADTVDLHRAIREGKQAGVEDELITNAEALYLSDAPAQADIAAAIAAIDEAIEAMTTGFEKEKRDLDALLTMADDLGFFDSSYERYGDVTEADIALASPALTSETLRFHTKVVRRLIADELFNGDLHDAFIRCINAWEYNYTSASYKNLLEAVSEAWDLCAGLSKAGGNEAEAIAILDAAYDELVPVDTEATTADFFEGWTTTQVNDVVDANSAKLCDSIGDGLNADGVWNAGDFSRNTTFEADGNFSMTADADFAGKSMGWKNMDRSGTLAVKANAAYPTMNVAGLSASEGIRFKVAADGYVSRILIGLSNCADTTREQYALRIRPEFADENGYITIPFSYFEPAFWCNAFSQDELENVIVFIVEAYGVDEDTTITFSDFRGYKKRDTTFDRLNDVWEYNYTADSWAAFRTAADAAQNAADVNAALALLVPRKTVAVTEDFFKGWTTDDVNAVVTANSDKLCDSIGEGLNVDGAWNAGDFSNNTTFAMENGAFTMTATADFTGKAMGWKNMDRSQTLQPANNGAYPALTVEGLSKAEGIRFKLEANKPVERILIGLSNCSKFVREMYAMQIKPEYVDADGYINIPFSYFEKAFWCSAFAQSELEDVIVFIVEAYGAANGTKIAISDVRGYFTRDFDDSALPAWQYNYTADSWAAYSDAISVAKTADERDAALALLKAYPVKTVTEDFFKGWTTDDVNAVVNANSDKLCDSIGEGLNINNAWNAGDFSRNTTFAMENGAFTMTATADFTGKAMGWKNMDRSQTLQPANNGAYPALTVEGLSKAEGIRFKLEANKPVERILIGLSNCSKFVREMYAMQIKPEYVAEDGYINIPFSYFEKAFWCDAFAQSELEDVIVFIIEAYGAENGTKIAVSDVRGYKLLIPATEEDFAALKTAVDTLKEFDLDGTHFADAYALAESVADSDDHEEVAPVVEELQGIVDSFCAPIRKNIKAKIEELEVLDVTGYFADEIADFKDRYYGELSNNSAVMLMQEIQGCIDQFSTPDAPAAPEVAEIGTDKIVLTAVEGVEYKCGDGEWQASAEFTGLTPNTEYTFYARYFAQGVSSASEASEGTVAKTAKEEINGALSVDGDFRYGATATATFEPDVVGDYDYVIEWYAAGGDLLGTGETYTFVADDIGISFNVKVTSEDLEGFISASDLGPVEKGLVTVNAEPTAELLPLGMSLANAVLTGGDTDVAGTWAFVTPDVIPEYEQSGSEFDVTFTPDDADLYEVYTCKVAVEINAVTEPKTVVNTDFGYVELSGDFHDLSVTTFEMEKITPRQTAYFDLLRAANRSGSEKNIIFMYAIEFDTAIAPYIGTLTFKADLSADRAGETYTVWFFTKDGVVGKEGTVNADGTITVEGLKF